MKTFLFGLFFGATGAAFAYVFRAHIEAGIEKILARWRGK